MLAARLLPLASLVMHYIRHLGPIPSRVIHSFTRVSDVQWQAVSFVARVFEPKR